MDAAIKIAGRQCKGITVKRLLQNLSSASSGYEKMLKKGSIVLINGRQLPAGEFGSYVIMEKDSIIILPVFAGG